MVEKRLGHGLHARNSAGGKKNFIGQPAGAVRTGSNLGAKPLFGRGPFKKREEDLEVENLGIKYQKIFSV